MPDSLSRSHPSRHRRWRSGLALAVALVTLGCAADPAPDLLVPTWSEGRAPLDGRVSPFGTGRSAIANLDPDLLGAVQSAARDAERDGVTLAVNSGWRSRAHQQALFAEAVAEYGSEEEALRWAATPDTSEHVTGDAVDIGPPRAAAWLGEHGAAYGLCRTFANEAWHFELATAPGDRCPAMLPDAGSRP